VRDNQRNYLVVGIFVLAILAGLIGSLALLAGRTGATDVYFTAFDNVAGVAPGTQVLYEGYPIGQVERILPAPAGEGPRYRVEMSVVRGWRLPEDSEALISAPGLLAPLTIDIRAGKSAQVLAPGALVRGVEGGNVFAAVGDAATNLNDLTKNSLRPLVETINERAPAILTNLEELSAQLTQASRGVNQVLNDENRAELHRILANLGEASSAVTRLAQEVSGVLARVDGMVADNRENVDQALDGLNHSLQSIARHIDALNQNLEGTSRNMNEFSRRIRHNPGLLLRGGSSGDDGAEP
jgi:phospholipid/cholesterol/gamma-HCH transport system substrate-binding protein